MHTDNLTNWSEAHPVEHEWLISNKATDSFAASLFDSLTHWGSLTEKQLLAVQRNLTAEHFDVFDVLDLGDEAWGSGTKYCRRMGFDMWGAVWQ